MEQTMNNEPKYRMNIKQNTKLEKYWDITCRGDSIEELAVDIEKLKKLAMIQSGQIIATASDTDTKDYKGD